MGNSAKRVCLIVVSIWTAFCAVGVSEETRKPVNHSDKGPIYFEAPGQEEVMAAFNQMLFQHKVFFRQFGTLWDQWLPRSTIWAHDPFSPELCDMLSNDPAMPHTQMTQGFYMSIDDMRRHVGQRLLAREMDKDGYVSTMQHRGMGHPSGWPFPLFGQMGGVGWLFSHTRMPYAPGQPRHENLAGWQAENILSEKWNPDRGIILELGPQATLATPVFDCQGRAAPFFRIDWWALEGMEMCQPLVQWATKENPGFSMDRSVHLNPPEQDGAMKFENQTFSVGPLWRHIQRDDSITQFRIVFNNPGTARICIQAIMTSADTRHNVNNSAWVRGCADYFHWTGDRGFLGKAMPRLHKAIAFAIKEFQVEKKGCVFTPWFGHEGTSGLVYKDGKKVVRPGYGVGSNYWDLLPFGGHDALATAYLIDALKAMAGLEESVRNHPEWNIATGNNSPGKLRELAERMRKESGQHFWNPETGRFAASRDKEGELHDYGMTFVNLESIYYGMTNSEQERSIMSWINGDRYILEDTSHGLDIYLWRFGPRATTRRNIDYYFCGWIVPDSIPWGRQVQDGGAVLGFSYFDLMARIKVLGPDNAWNRVQEIAKWFQEVQEAGGYTAFYQQPAQGVLQGGIHGTGALGVDTEFAESVLLPQVMLYGFLGFQPNPEGFTIKPQLPAACPTLTVHRINFRNLVMDITVGPEGIIFAVREGEGRFPVGLGEGNWTIHQKNQAPQKVLINKDHPTVKIQFNPNDLIRLSQ